ncbi:MAG: glucose-6-phosphate isomerase [Xanthomonadales bacterium]|nr:glucose-6-phosphate isomerase [Xanthomonadales bacterium]
MSNSIQKRSRLLQQLQKNNTGGPPLSDRLLANGDRFERFSRSMDGLLIDFSRTAIGEREFDHLLELARDAGVEAQRERMYRGEKINFTEDRAVLHPLWRERNFADVLPAAEAQRLAATQTQMARAADALHGGHLPGGGAAIRHILHVGIGGSLLGPRLLCEAFPPAGDCPEIHFLSSVDALQREMLLTRIDPRETAVILVSKSFTTSEVLQHAQRIRQWQLDALDPDAANRRLFAVTAAGDKAESFGVPAENTLDMGEWTGGRFSVWSPVGFTAAISMGPTRFEAFLDGGAEMDRHFRDRPLADNLPVILALVSVWHRNACAYDVHGLIPYDSRLAGLPAWLQQVEMESNGKSVDTTGSAVSLQTAPVVMGDTGTDAQHALFQAFHQGTAIVPLDFVGVIQPDHADIESQRRLLSHLLAQATALAVGQGETRVRSLMQEQGVPETEIGALLPHRLMPGDRPSTVILLDRLTPASLGRLLALYEHKVFVESVIWGINAFDQWGVELGKSLADAIEPALADSEAVLPPEIPGLDGPLAYIRDRLPD